MTMWPWEALPYDELHLWEVELTCGRQQRVVTVAAVGSLEAMRRARHQLVGLVPRSKEWMVKTCLPAK